MRITSQAWSANVLHRLLIWRRARHQVGDLPRRGEQAAMLALLLLLLCSCLPAPGDAILPQATASPASAWWSAYFSDPQGPTAVTLQGGPDAALAQAIDAARYSVDVAVYHFNLWSVRDALLRAQQRGVTVRFVTESDDILEPEVQELQAAGIPVLGDRRETLMHHKFVVIDRIEVWTGSMNLTVGSAYRDDNNLLRIFSSEVAEDYTREFEEMFLEDRFGALSLADTPFPHVMVDGSLVEVYFSPDDGIAYRLVELIRGAQESIDFLAYSFTLDALSAALLERALDGVTVRGVLEYSQADNAGSDFTVLRQAGLDVRRDANQGNMHHKVIVIDGSIVVTGSYNFSRSAEESNDENVVVVHDAALAYLYLQEFERLFQSAVK
jgi:phosphatidylserine/phosphatidylglycerophosphate/cardiolipin synthase-like enzyme